MKYQCPKGLFDILPYGTEEKWQLSYYWQILEDKLKKLAHLFGFKELRTPIFEHTELFSRSVGETSDIVTKEMYTFFDKANRSITLRPEGTASILRAFIEKNMHQLRRVHKFFYLGPMFRYERPQAGRFRQLHQFGIETLGPSSLSRDAETLDLLYETLHQFGIEATIVINSIGDKACREKYKNALVNYFKPIAGDLSPESQARLDKNPLRILDSKSVQDQPFIKNAPSILDFLSSNDQKEFEELQQILTKMKIPFLVDHNLVRGLDYYDRLVFEMRSENLGAQNAVGGGGRYTDLISDLGGPSLPGIGFAIGLERMLQVVIAKDLQLSDQFVPFYYLVPLGEEAKEKALLLATDLRKAQIPVDIDLDSKKVGQALKNGDLLQANFAVIIGEEELMTRKAKLKNLLSREQIEIDFSTLTQNLKRIWEDAKL